MSTLMQDVRYALRMLTKSPGFTAVAVLTLALGIGANTAVFSAVSAFLLRPVPFEDGDRLVVLHTRSLRDGQTYLGVSLPDFADWREHAATFSEMVVFTWPGGFNMSGGDEPEQVRGSAVGENLLHLLRVRPVQGRGFLLEENRPGGAPVALISHALWQRRFGGRAGVVGETILLNHQAHTVVGVLPPGFDFPMRTDLWVPLASLYNQSAASSGGAAGSAPMMDRAHRRLLAWGRLGHGATIEQARRELDLICDRLARAYPDTNRDVGAHLVSMREWMRAESGSLVLLLQATVAVVLAIACANLANLLLARGATRTGEMAVRAALGAGRARLARQLLTESSLLGVLGAAFGLIGAYWLIDLLNLLFEPPQGAGFRVGVPVLAYALAMGLLTGVLFGIVPALQATKTNLVDALKGMGRRASGAGGSVARSVFVVAQLSMALLLLAAAGLMIKNFVQVSAIDAGFADPRQLQQAWLNLPAARYTDSAQIRAFADTAVQRLQQTPGVAAAAAASRVEFDASGNPRRRFTVEGRPADEVETMEATSLAVTPDYFRAMGIPILRGRGFHAQDNHPGARVIVISEQVAQRYWPNADPLGRQIKLGGPGSSRPWLTVIGVAADARFPGWWEMTIRPLNFYVPFAHEPRKSLELVARTGLLPAAVSAAFRGAVGAADREQSIQFIRSYEEALGRESQGSRMMASLMGLFAAIALALAVVGIYGVMSYSVAHRTREIGIRMALGAQKQDVLKMVLARGAVLALAGTLAGIAGTLALTGVMTRLLGEVGSTLDYGMNPTDPAVFGGVSLLLALAALVACYVPARRAARVEPMVALRHE